MTTASTQTYEGVLLLDKPKGLTSFAMVAKLRRLTHVKKIGHAGTLDPMATGVMVMLIGKKYTRKSDQFLCQDKEYLTTLKLGEETDSFDAEGKITHTSPTIPSMQEISLCLEKFQGEISQIPPMFSAKKVKGQKLCDLARKGVEIERAPQKVKVNITFIGYNYPELKLKVACSKGTYIRSLAHDIGMALGCFAHLIELKRTKSGKFLIEECTPIADFEKNPALLAERIQTLNE